MCLFEIDKKNRGVFMSKKTIPNYNDMEYLYSVEREDEGGKYTLYVTNDADEMINGIVLGPNGFQSSGLCRWVKQDLIDDGYAFEKSSPQIYSSNSDELTYVNIDEVSRCGRLFVDKAKQLDTLMDDLNTQFVKTINMSWKDDNSETLKQMFSEFIMEAKKVNSNVKDYGRTITDAALDYSTEQRNAIMKLGDERYGK